jgi:predicted alpha/beta-hydrolase family hydrolase
MPDRWILLAPGAGAPSTSPWMRRWARYLAALGPVAAFDYPYMLAGRRSPDPLPRLVAAHREALRRAAKDSPGPHVLVGKSMGSRVGCHVALAEPSVRALVCLGDPLRGASGAIRDQVLLELTTPILFVQGSRDPLCPIDLLERVRAKMRAPSRLCVVDGGNHSLAVNQRELAARGTTQAETERRLVDAIRGFVDEYG